MSEEPLTKSTSIGLFWKGLAEEEKNRAEKAEVERDELRQKLAEQEAAWQQDLRTGARALRERDELRAALTAISAGDVADCSGFARAALGAGLR